MRFVIIISLSFFLAQNLFGQNVFRDLKSLEKRGDRHFREMSYSTAIDLYRQALDKQRYKDNNLIRIKVARAYQRIGQPEEAERYYREALIRGFKPQKKDSIEFGRLLIVNNKYQEAQGWLSTSVDRDTDPASYEQYKSISQPHRLYRDSFSFLARPIIYNSPYSDYGPAFYKNGIIFSSDRPMEKFIKQVNMQKDAGFSELYFFRERDTVQRPAQHFPVDLKTPLHKGPAVFYNKGNKMILTANINKTGVSRLQMFTAEWDNKKSEWTNFKPFPFNSEFYSVGHPALSKDERTLYFVSDMPGGSGGTDIYVSVLKDGEWTSPKNLREPVNTEGNEMFPYISPAGKFYFSSDGHGGLGGLDFFYMDNTAQNVQQLVNPGYPLNSSADDFGIILDDQEKSGYFSSNRKGGKGGDDIYKLYIKRIELKLKVTDEVSTASSLLNPEVKLIDKETEEEIRPVQMVLSKENVISYTLKPQHEYKLSVKKDDYKNYEKEVSTMGMNDERTIELKATLKRKFEYYVTLKIRDIATENIVQNATLQLINITSRELDSIGVSKSGEADIKLDSESEYLLIAFKDNQFGQVAVEKPLKKKVSSVKFITMKIAPVEEKIYKMTAADTSGRVFPGEELIIRDMITGIEQKVTTSEVGAFEFTLRGGWYYRIYYNDKRLYYDSLTEMNNGNMRFNGK